jgi:hypothetical protein
MLSPKLLARVASRMQQVWSAKARSLNEARYDSLRRLRERLYDLDLALARFERTRQRGATILLPRLEEQLPGQVQAVLNAASQARQNLEQTPTVPELATLVPELQQLEVEFGGLHIDLEEAIVSVTTDPITLAGVHLGAFTIQLDWRHLTDDAEGQCLKILARDPNPAATADDVTHPHVKYESLCAGDAKVPLRKALEQGRLSDAFNLVNSVLSHYNPKSAHVRLDDWEGSLCQDCGAACSDDERYNCDGCNNYVCSDCLESCASCDRGRCGNCLSPCAVCEVRYCNSCLTACASTDKECCSNCLKPCAECEHLVATDELEAESGLCPECAGADAADDKAVPAAAEASTGDHEEVENDPIEAARDESTTSIPPETQTHDANRAEPESLAAACP